MIRQHVIIPQQDQLCFSQMPFQVCAEGFRVETEFPQTMPMICMNADSSEAIQAMEQIKNGQKLPQLKQKAAFEVQHMQRRAPHTCVEKTDDDEFEQPKPVDIRKKMRSNWVPIMRTGTETSNRNNEEQFDQRDLSERTLRPMTEEQESEWVSEVTDKESLKAQKHLKESMIVGDYQRPRLNLHKIMRMPEKEYQQWKTEMIKAARYPYNAQWLAKYEQQLPLIYTNVVNNLRNEIGTYYPEQESQNELQLQFTRAVERAYLFVVQQVILERYHAPKDEQELPLYASVQAMAKKVWITLQLELSPTEVENVQNSVQVYLQKLQNERPSDYELQFQLPSKLTFDKTTDLTQTAKDLLKIAQTGLRLAAQKPHDYDAPETEHLNWAFSDEQAQREVEEAKRWSQNKKNSVQRNKQQNDNQDQDQDQQDANQQYLKQKNSQWFQNKQKQDSYDSEYKYEDENTETEKQQDGQSLFNKLKVAIRSFEKTIRDYQS